MPITPFHFFPGILFKSFGGARISWVVFALANILIDIEPVTWFLTTGQPIHPYAHTYLGALIVGVTITATAVWSGALIGTFSHIALDSVMHGDVTPLWPFASGNVLLQIISIEVLHGVCIAAGVWGVLRLLVLRAEASLTGLARRALTFGNSLLSAMILTLVLVGGFVWLGSPSKPAALDATAWRNVAVHTHFSNPRWPMAQATLAGLLRDKPGRAEALRQLGQPDALGSTSTRLSYYLGFPGWLSMDPYTLDIEFNEEGRFLHATIVQH